MHTVRENIQGDMGGSGKNAGNNWKKFSAGSKIVPEDKQAKTKPIQTPRKPLKG